MYRDPITPDQRMRFAFERVHSGDLRHLLAMLELPDGRKRMRYALMTVLADRSEREQDGPAALDERNRRLRESLYVILNDRVKLPRIADVAAVGEAYLGLPPPFEGRRLQLLGRRDLMTNLWRRLRELPTAQRRARINRLVEALCGRGWVCPGTRPESAMPG